MKLNDEELDDMRNYPPLKCSSCDATLCKNYCSYCDEFFNEGHKSDCKILNDPKSREDHRGHETY